MNEPRPIFATLQPHMLKRHVCIINHNTILILRSPYSRNMKRNLRFGPHCLLILSRHRNSRCHRTRLRTHPWSHIPSSPFLLPPRNQLKPILLHRVLCRMPSLLLLLPNPPELIHGWIKPFQNVIVHVHKPVIGIIDVGRERNVFRGADGLQHRPWLPRDFLDGDLKLLEVAVEVEVLVRREAARGRSEPCHRWGERTRC